MPAIGRSPLELYERSAFIVEVEGVARAAFHRCSELKASVAEIQYYEGGSRIPIKLPGLMSFEDVTLERGISTDRDLYEWMLQVCNAAIGATDPAGTGIGQGVLDPAFRRNLTIRQRRRDNSTARTWDLFAAWPKSFTAGSWDNGVSEVVIEQVVIAYDYFQSS